MQDRYDDGVREYEKGGKRFRSRSSSISSDSFESRTSRS